MRNKIAFSLAVMAIFTLVAPAAATVIYPTPPPTDSGLFFGQSHSYSVVFRGNGEAIVFGKMTFTNTEEETLKNFTFTIPRVRPTELVILQQKIKPVCVQYDYQKPYDPSTGLYPCFQYQEQADYYLGGGYAYPYPGQPTEYQKVKFTESGGVYNLTLPIPVAPSKTGVILFSYAAFGYVKQSAGLYKFTFETPKVLSRVNSLRVAADVDSDLFLKGKKSEVNYNIPSQDAFRSAAPAGQSLASPALDALSTSIGSYGQLVKEAKNLAPNESFLVKGEYARNKIRLYLDSIIWTILIITAIFLGIYKLTKLIKKRKKAGNASTFAQTQIGEGISILNLTNAGAGLLSAVLVLVLTFLVKYLSGLFHNYYNYYGYGGGQMFMLLFFIMMLLLYVLVIFGPAVYIGSKNGARAGVSVLIAEFLWLVIFLVLFALLFQSGVTNGIFPRPYPAMYERG